MADIPRIVLPHGGYRNLIVNRKSDVIYQGTVAFCRRFLPPRGDRTVDQMTQAARSCKQNIAEGSAASGTSKETEIKLTNVARATLDELLEDYLDYLKSHGAAEWDSAGEKKTAARLELADGASRTPRPTNPLADGASRTPRPTNPPNGRARPLDAPFQSAIAAAAQAILDAREIPRRVARRPPRPSDDAARSPRRARRQRPRRRDARTNLESRMENKTEEELVTAEPETAAHLFALYKEKDSSL